MKIRKTTVLKTSIAFILAMSLSACSLFTSKNANTALDLGSIACLAAKVVVIEDDSAVLKACEIFGQLEGPAREVIKEQRKSNAAAVAAVHTSSCGGKDAGTDAH